MHHAVPTTPKLAYSIREASEASSLSKTTLYKEIKAKRLQAVHIGGRTIIPAESLIALVTGLSANDRDPGDNE